MGMVFLDRQHTGNPKAIQSMGAGADIDGDGKTEIWEMEAIWTAKYLLAAELRLRDLGHLIIPICDGTYVERHKRVNQYMRNWPNSVYVAAHINAGKGDYGSVFWDHRSTKGPILAGKIAVEMKKLLPEIKQNAKSIPCTPKNWTKNAFFTIRHTQAVAVCYEPCFIDSLAHRGLFSQNGMDRIGWALANGIHEYFQELS